MKKSQSQTFESLQILAYQKLGSYQIEGIWHFGMTLVQHTPVAQVLPAELRRLWHVFQEYHGCLLVLQVTRCLQQANATVNASA